MAADADPETCTQVKVTHERLYGGARWKTGVERRQFFKWDWLSNEFDRFDDFYVYKRGDAFHMFKEYVLAEELGRRFPGWFPQVCKWFNYDAPFSGGFKAEYDVPGQPAEVRFKLEVPLTKVRFTSPRLEELLDIIPKFHKIAYLPRKNYHPGYKRFDPEKFKYCDVHYFSELLQAVYDKAQGYGIAPLLGDKAYFSPEEMWSGCADPDKYPHLHDIGPLIRSLKEKSRYVDEVTQFIINSTTAQEDYRGCQVINGDLRIENLLLHLDWLDDSKKAEIILSSSEDIIVGNEGHLVICDLEAADVGLRYRDISKLLESHNIDILAGRKLSIEDKMEFLSRYMKKFHTYDIRNDILLEAEPLYWAQAYLDNLRLARSCLIEEGIYRSEFAVCYLEQADRAYENYAIAKERFSVGKMGILGQFIPMKKSIFGSLLERIMPDSYHTSTKISDPAQIVYEMAGKHPFRTGKPAIAY